METFVITSIIIHLLFLLYVSFKLVQLNSKAKRIADSTKDNFHLNLFNSYEQNPKYKKIHQILQLPSDNQQVTDLFSNNNQDLIEYLEFLNFVSGIHSDEVLRLQIIYGRFYKQFDALRKHQELYGELIHKNYFYIDLLFDRC